jgi:RNA polymerase primary sigma factor
MSDNKSALNVYLKEMYKYETISKEEEITLARKIQDSGDEAALDKLIKHNLRIVIWLAKRETSWDNSKVPIEDIISFGNEALFMAALKWDPNGSARFSAFAKPFIRLGIKRGVAKTENIVSLPIGITEKIRKMQYHERILLQKLGRPPRTDELAEETKFSTKRIITLKNILTREPISLDALNIANQRLEENVDE